MRKQGKRRLWAFGLGLVSCVLSIAPTVSVAVDEAKARDAAYLEQVVGVMRSHVASMRMILDHDEMKYSDNIVRHAEAFERTFGMVGPMEWHAAEAFGYMAKSDQSEKLSEAQFEELAEESQVAINKIKRSAKRFMRDKNKDLMRGSINNMIKSCGACHSKMPKGTVPSVWKGMKE